ncbi:MAG: hypothetical protein WB800_17640 [Streptosporangiaceae bacterium]
MTGWPELEEFLRTDPRDVGCDQALRIPHAYLDPALSDRTGSAACQYPGVAGHRLACGPCGDDYDDLLAAAGRAGDDDT